MLPLVATIALLGGFGTFSPAVVSQSMFTAIVGAGILGSMIVAIIVIADTEGDASREDWAATTTAPELTLVDTRFPTQPAAFEDRQPGDATMRCEETTVRITGTIVVQVLATVPSYGRWCTTFTRASSAWSSERLPHRQT